LGEHLGGLLRSAFVGPETEPLPQIFLDLLSQLAAIDAATNERVEAPHALSDDQFKLELAQVIPQLRAFGRTLSGSADQADDLVQETMMKAWAARDRFQAGTSMRAWTFTILRNQFLSQARRARFKGEWDPVAADRLLARAAEQDKKIELSDLQRALMQLPAAQREALILVGAGGFSYEEVAEIAGCQLGTIKSRVARGRAALEQIIDAGKLPMPRHVEVDDLGSAFDGIMAQVDELAGG